MSDDSNEVIFYHYTSKKYKDDILVSGVIKPSTRCGRGKDDAMYGDGKQITRRGRGKDDAMYGDGVYGTRLDPNKFSKAELLMNNYDSRTGVRRSHLQEGKVDVAFKLYLPKDSVKEIEADGRNILIHHGDINLDNVRYEVIPVPSGN